MIQQISVFIENKKGRLAFITEVLAKAGVDIRAMSVADTSDFGILRLIVDNPDKAVEAFRNENMAVSLIDVLAVGVNDTPGGLAAATNALWSNGISVEYAYAFISQKDGTAFVILRVDDNDKAVKVLKDNGIILLTEEEIMAMSNPQGQQP